jgi:dynein intermediate chain 1
MGGGDSRPLVRFDVGQSGVGDIDWSPVKSTVFVAVNGEGTVYMYDLERTRTRDVVSQRIVKKGKLTRVAFHSKGTAIIVGDDRGSVYSLKISQTKSQTNITESERLKSVINILTEV